MALAPTHGNQGSFSGFLSRVPLVGVRWVPYGLPESTAPTGIALPRTSSLPLLWRNHGGCILVYGVGCVI